MLTSPRFSSILFPRLTSRLPLSLSTPSWIDARSHQRNKSSCSSQSDEESIASTDRVPPPAPRLPLHADPKDEIDRFFAKLKTMSDEEVKTMLDVRIPILQTILREIERVEAEENARSRVNPLTGEVDGPSGPEPTRFGDWERNGRVSDF